MSIAAIVLSPFSVDTDFLKRVTSANPKPKVKLRRSDHHLENRYNIFPLRMVRFEWNLAARTDAKWQCRVRWCGRNRNLIFATTQQPISRFQRNFAWANSFSPNFGNETYTHVPQNVFFWYLNAVWASAIGGCGIVSDTLLCGFAYRIVSYHNRSCIPLAPPGECKPKLYSQ